MRHYKGNNSNIWTKLALMAIILILSIPSLMIQIDVGKTVPYSIQTSDVATDLDNAWEIHDQLIIQLQKFDNWFQADLSPIINDINLARINLNNAEDYIAQLNDVAAANEINLAEKALSSAESRLDEVELNQSTTILLLVSIIIIIIVACMICILFIIKSRKKMKKQREQSFLDSKIDYDAMKQAGIID